MNYFAHGREFVDNPYFLAGTAVPDWLSVVDRKTRVRSRQALAHLAADCPLVRAVAAGIVRHCHDDNWFHGTVAFTQLSLDFTRQIRDHLGQDAGFRPYFVGHILVEMLLDAELIEAHPAMLTAYYRAVDRLDAPRVAEAVGRMGRGEGASRLAGFIPLFSADQFLWDYLDDAKLLVRLNQVMRRATLPALPASFARLLPAFRRAVAERQEELLAAPAPAPGTNGHEIRPAFAAVDGEARRWAVAGAGEGQAAGL